MDAIFRGAGFVARAAFVLAAAFSGVGAHAELQSRAGGTMVYDTDLDVTWLANANQAGRAMTWREAVDWAAALEYGGFNDWRLPSARDVRTQQLCAGTVDSGCISEMGHLFKSELGGFYGATLAELGLAPGQGGLFRNFPADGYFYWLAESNPLCCNPPNDNAYVFAFQSEPGYARSGEQGLLYIGQRSGKYAWAVRNGDVSLAPGGLAMVDYSDLWSNPDEQGWGVNIVHQRDTIFLTLFVYEADGEPTWFVASGATWLGTEHGEVRFSGWFYRMTGPSYAGIFDPSRVHAASVGTVSLLFSSPTHGRLQYVVDGRTYNKAIDRQTWKIADATGTYVGASIGRKYDCRTVPNVAMEEHGTIVVSQPAHNRIVFSASGPSGSCTYSGDYRQAGRLGSSTGTHSCTDGDSGPFSMSEIQVSPLGVMTRVEAGPNTPSGCRFSGLLGGVRKEP